MTTNLQGEKTIGSAPITNLPFSHGDPRGVFAQAVSTATSVISHVRPDQLDRATPCTEFNVRQLLAHLVMGLGTVATLGRGEDPFAGPRAEAEAPGDDWKATWSAAAHEVQEAWTDDAVLTRMMRVPWAELPGAVMLEMYTGEVVVHTWDLAQATGQQPAWDPRVLEVAFEKLHASMPAEGRAAIFEQARANMPEDLRTPAAPFAEVVPVPDDAPLIDRIVAWTGRRP